ncbi:hypothetical protein CHU32_02055 [Superficieibacter electus]|uniref:Uncharacterized protein n=1 Tax=Superficieibacter electus TaxID=2022662 RepID=A0A2P5GUI1_9ENTR|nr:hypothetical protein [Superficieibacter electus]POP40881.1 hypothetical protein CHU33_24975 [Superficieibacter electus]POP50230.1 hypothetical protein CHU32_02055 [Superficieibacter electus]
MKRSEIEQLTDELIGEAVLSLLADNSPINTQTLINRLRSIESSESNHQRRDILSGIIAEISGTAERKHTIRESSQWNEDNVHQLFGSRRQSGKSKNH